MSNIIDKIQVSGVTYDIQGSGGGGITVDPTLDSGSTNPVANSAITTALDAKVNVADNAVSTKAIMYAYDKGDTAWKYPYNQGLRINQFFVKYTESWENSNVPAWNNPMYITNDGSTTSQINLRVNASNYQITSVASTSGDFTYALEGGQVIVTLPSGYYVSSFAQRYNFQIIYPKYVINGGQSAQALQNTENVLNDIYSEMPKRWITGGSISCNFNYLNSYLYDNNGNDNSSMMPLGTSIKGEGNKLDVYFDGQTIHQKILNTGSGNYCNVPNNPAWNYTDDLNEIIIHFNSGYTGSNTSYTILVQTIDTNTWTYSDNLYYDVANHTLDASSANYVTATTVGDDYTYSIKPKQEYSSYKILTIRENNWCNIAGIDNQRKEEYIITGVTTPSYSYQAQEIIDDLYSKVGSGITSGEVQTMIDESISGKADTNNTVQRIGVSTLADGKSITAVIPSGNTYTATIFKVGNGLTWQAYNSTIVVDTSKIAQKTDIPTVSSAITSGDTNPVQGGVLYDKFDEIEQVTAAALNELNDKIEEGGGGNPTVELSQAEYDALVSAGTVSADTYYIITDATAFDPSTKVDTSAFTAYSAATNTALNGKVNTSSVVTAVTSASTDSEIPTAKAVWEAASGGGTTYTAGRGIDITNDTISFNLPISAGTGTNALVIASDTYEISNKAKGEYSVCLNGGGYHPNYAYGTSSHAQGMDTKAYGAACHSEGYGSKAGVENNYNIQYAHAEGDHTEAKGTASHAEGFYTIANNQYEHASGRYNVSNKANTTFGDSGNTLFSVGNGTANNARHNVFEIRQNGDIYFSYGGADIMLQNKIAELEEVIARALNDLNDRITAIENQLNI